MKKGTKLPVKYNGKVVGEAEVFDVGHKPIEITITDPAFEKLIGSSFVEGVAYRKILDNLEAFPRFSGDDKKEN